MQVTATPPHQPASGEGKVVVFLIFGRSPSQDSFTSRTVSLTFPGL